MEARIQALTDLVLQGKMYPHPVKTEYDRMDLLLPQEERNVKRLCEYIRNQEPVLTEHSAFTGMFVFDGSCVGDAFKRGGHPHTQEVMDQFYLKSVDNLSTMEWQHATADYQKVLKKGIRGIMQEIADSMKVHHAPEELSFLNGLEKAAQALIDWSLKCAGRVKKFAETVSSAEAKQRLEKLACALERVPANAPSSFYEAVLTIYVCFSADPDSLGTLDRYLSPFYFRDMEQGTLSREEAKAYLQELFLMLQAAERFGSQNFTRGGQSHFCIGGYLPNGEDGFNELSKLIVESMIELPTYIPQITLRWTAKTPREVLYYMMDSERKDPHKRIAFTNDEKRLKCYTEICGFPFEKAVAYTTVGCNEPAFLGAIIGSTSKGNFAHCMEVLFHQHAEEAIGAKDFETFYALFERLMRADLEKIHEFDNLYNAARARDINYVTSLLFNDCIENAKSLTQGGGNTVIASPMLMGITNVIDSLCVVKEFVYDQQLITMQELADALKNNWEGFEDLRRMIVNKGHFYGNDDELSNGIARRLYESLYQFLKNKKNLYGYQWLIGDLMGYNEHYQWFGSRTLATPDGRHSGDPLKFGLGQSEGRDRNGLTALLNAIAQTDPHAIGCGATVTNVTLDEQLIRNDESFAKTVEIFETFFKNGGVHFQLNYVSREELMRAKEVPDDYRNLRVRVSGFSDYFTKLRETVQDDIIKRTTQH